MTYFHRFFRTISGVLDINVNAINDRLLLKLFCILTNGLDLVVVKASLELQVLNISNNLTSVFLVLNISNILTSLFFVLNIFNIFTSVFLVFSILLPLPAHRHTLSQEVGSTSPQFRCTPVFLCNDWETFWSQITCCLNVIEHCFSKVSSQIWE